MRPDVDKGGQEAPAVPPAPQVSLDVLPNSNVSTDQPNILNGDTSSASGTHMVVDEASGSGTFGAAAAPATSSIKHPTPSAFTMHQNLLRKSAKNKMKLAESRSKSVLQSVPEHAGSDFAAASTGGGLAIASAGSAKPRNKSARDMATEKFGPQLYTKSQQVSPWDPNAVRVLAFFCTCCDLQWRICGQCQWCWQYLTDNRWVNIHRKDATEDQQKDHDREVVHKPKTDRKPRT